MTNRDRFHIVRGLLGLVVLILVQSTTVVRAQNSNYEFPDESYAIVTAIKANVRGTPNATGAVLTTVEQGKSFDQIAKKGPWYLIQTEKYAGWIHGSAIRLSNIRSYSNSDDDRRPVPKTTAVLRGGNSPFSSEYIGGDTILVVIQNDAYKDLNLTLGGVKYFVASGTTKSIDVDEGTYDYFATAPGVRSLSGSAGFERGHRYRWTFYIVTTTR